MAGSCFSSFPPDRRASAAGPISTSASTTSAEPAAEIEAIGGVTVRSPEFYVPEGSDVLEWAVMHDPFGNEFCIIRWPLD